MRWSATVDGPLQPGLGAKEIGVDAGVAVLAGPERERDGSEVVDERDGVAVFGEVDGADVEVAGVAGFDAKVRKLLDHINGELALGFFAASGTEDAAKIPFVKTERAY